jgi:hypothetical protein
MRSIFLGVILLSALCACAQPSAAAQQPEPQVGTFEPKPGEAGEAPPPGIAPGDSRIVVRGAPDAMIASAAQVLGMDEASVRAEWSARPLSEVAVERGVEPGAVADALAEADDERLVKDAAAGRIPPTEVEPMRQQIRQAIARLIEQALPPPGDGAPVFKNVEGNQP